MRTIGLQTRRVKLGLAGAAVLALVSGCSSVEVTDADEGAVRASIQEFIASYNDSDLARIRTLVCGDLEDAYEFVESEEDFREIVSVARDRNGPVSVEVKEVTIAGDSATATGITTYEHPGSSQRMPAETVFTLERQDSHWKVCSEKREVLNDESASASPTA